jgi:hypothetical protein
MIIQPIDPKLKFEHRLFILEDMPKGACCAEIGVLEGTFSQHIISITKPNELHLIDPWMIPGSWQTFNRNKEHFEECNYHIHKQKFESTKFPNEYFDWMYLDNGHKFVESYDQLKLAYKKVKKGGWLIGDDYGGGHPQQILAVNLFVKNFDVEWIPVGGWQFKIRKI